MSGVGVAHSEESTVSSMDFELLFVGFWMIWVPIVKMKNH